VAQMSITIAARDLSPDHAMAVVSVCNNSVI